MSGQFEAVTQMLARPQNVLVYSPGDEDAARAVMQVVTEQLADEMKVSDPELANLTVLDHKAGVEEWEEFLPTVEVGTLQDLAAGNLVLHPSQCLVSMAPEFLRRRASRRFASATRFYAMTPHREHALNILTRPITLEGVA